MCTTALNTEEKGFLKVKFPPLRRDREFLLTPVVTGGLYAGRRRLTTVEDYQRWLGSVALLEPDGSVRGPSGRLLGTIADIEILEVVSEPDRLELGC